MFWHQYCIIMCTYLLVNLVKYAFSCAFFLYKSPGLQTFDLQPIRHKSIQISEYFDKSSEHRNDGQFIDTSFCVESLKITIPYFFKSNSCILNVLFNIWFYFSTVLLQFIWKITVFSYSHGQCFICRTLY